MCLYDPKDGSLRRLTFDQDANWAPTVMNNGRIMYTRWEYTDLTHYFSRFVMHMNQDGTEQKLNADTRVCFSYVPQGNTLLAGSIAENLSIAKEGASREEMKTALEMACAWEFVKKLQEGLETKLGERGKGLSEGQSQRIAIARALLRNAPVILLDEATSALDEETEKKLLKNILEKAPEKTCIVTTHRPGVLRLCRRVYRVENGKIAEMSDLGEKRK